ncbi:UbiH/UbiF family hydroxylase [Rhizobium halophytocola]|uniref:2-octaprenyl-6-methoxyphenol hydroxylase n=1 Tax=Rhizobium halophytocola TaxID=735519 RepID=A0ABS4DWK1_9HYPH|nr:UbiH/UbiF family hydroxylase [Rhizobium halophytocola]MBP1850066.1 2-octaprenyl-6-methoxyphenol hydroxylase [Rhizobium halophytocola]
MKHFEIAVIGAGLAGTIAAIALARRGRKVALIAPATRPDDQRTTALMDQSIGYLDRLGLWEAIRPAAAPLQVMQILDGTRRLLRAPPIAFRAGEIGLDAFGYNMPNAALIEALRPAAETEPNLTLIEASAETIDMTADSVSITLTTGDGVTADFIVGADGRASKTREAAGVAVKTWTYPQTAVVLNFAHRLPHRNVSTEFHTDHGPFTQVPLPGDRSSLVWVVAPKEAERLTGLGAAELSRAVETRMDALLGKVTVEGTAQAWPLSGMSARRYGKGRAAFIGEAAHAFPPIGAQGLNLSLRDVMALESLLAASGTEIRADVGDRYDAKRRADVWSRTASVDLLNRSLLSSFLPVQMLRAAGLHVLANLAPLRHLVMQEGVAPGFGFTRIGQGLREKVRRKKA